MERARAEQARTQQYLKELEDSIPTDTLTKWRLEEGQWKENVEHLERDGNAFESPYELKQGAGTLFLQPSPPLTANSRPLRHVTKRVACCSCEEKHADRRVGNIIVGCHRAGR